MGSGTLFPIFHNFMPADILLEPLKQHKPDISVANANVCEERVLFRRKLHNGTTLFHELWGTEKPNKTGRKNTSLPQPLWLRVTWRVFFTFVGSEMVVNSSGGRCFLKDVLFEFRTLPDLELRFMIRLKNTFLHLEDPSSTEVARRSASEPPPLRRQCTQPGDDAEVLQHKSPATRSVTSESEPYLMMMLGTTGSAQDAQVSSPCGQPLMMRSSTTGSAQDAQVSSPCGQPLMMMSSTTGSAQDAQVSSPYGQPLMMMSSTTGSAQDAQVSSPYGQPLMMMSSPYGQRLVVKSSTTGSAQDAQVSSPYGQPLMMKSITTGSAQDAQVSSPYGQPLMMMSSASGSAQDAQVSSPYGQSLMMKSITTGSAQDAQVSSPYGQPLMMKSITTGSAQDAQVSKGGRRRDDQALTLKEVVARQHQQGQCLPCMFFMKSPNLCRFGDECTHCHNCTTQEARRRRSKISYEKRKLNKAQAKRELFEA